MPRYDYELPGVKDPTRDWALVVDTDDAALHQQLLHDSLAYFAVHMLDMDAAEMHLEWSEAIAANDRLAIQAPRDHGKSAFWSYAYPIWQAWRNPGSLGYILSSNASLAVDLLSIVKEGHSGHEDNDEEGGGGQGGLKGLLDHPKLGYLVDLKNGWSQKEIRLTNGSVIRARGYGTRMRGGHPHWIVADDVLDERSMYSEIQREKTKTYFRSAITNMVLKGGQIVVVGTPFHRDDLYSYLSSNPRYRFIMYRALIEDATAPRASDGRRWRALWPERHNVEDLLAKKVEIGSVDFAREIMCEPITDDLTLFPSSLFVGDVFARHVPMPLSRAQMEQLGWTIYIGVDLAISANTGADYLRIVVLAQDRKYNRYVIDLYGGKGIAYKKQKELLIDVCTRYNPEAVLVEANQYQEVFGAELIEDTDLPIIKYRTGVEKNNLQQGVPMLRRLIENGKLRFARGNERAITRTDVIISELQCFGFVGGKLRGVGSHDDCVMALWFAVLAARGGESFKMSFGGRKKTDGTIEVPDGAAEEEEDEEAALLALVADDDDDVPDPHGGRGGFMM